MNKRNILNMFTIALFAAILSGCVEIKTLPPLNKTTAAEECAILVIPAEAKVKRIDGAKRGWLFSTWGIGFWGKFRATKAATLPVPAGEHTIMYEYAHPQEGWKFDKLENMVEMSAGKMYMLLVTRDKDVKVGTGSIAINLTTSFARDQIIENIPFIDWLPRSNPKGIASRISEIDQAAVDLHLLEMRTPWKKVLPGALVGIIWVFIIFFVLRFFMYFLFMGKLKNRHAVVAYILSICLSMAGVFIMNYNTDGILSLCILSTVLIGIGVSGFDMGGEHVTSGVNKFNNNDFSGAISDYTHAINLAPYNANNHNNRGMAYFRLKKWEEAIHDFTAAIELKPNVQYFINRGNAYCELQERQKAIADFTKAIALKPNAETYFCRGVVYSSLQDWGKSVADCTEAIKLVQNAGYINFRGLIYLCMLELEKAAADFAEAVRLAPDNADYKKNLAETQAQIANSKG